MKCIKCNRVVSAQNDRAKFSFKKPDMQKSKLFMFFISFYFVVGNFSKFSVNFLHVYVYHCSKKKPTNYRKYYEYYFPDSNKLSKTIWFIDKKESTES